MSARPGEILGIVDVDLPRPRRQELLSSPRTAELAAEIRTLLYSNDEAHDG
jgi:NitT/TauT family transport system ATP-binding protein